MNYSKKKTRTKAIIISWIVCLLIGALLGYVLTALFHDCGHPSSSEETEAESQAMYGTRDGRVFTNGCEMSMDWSSGDLNFIPLDVPLNAETQEFIYYLSYGYYIDFPFVMGLIQQESSFKPNCISKTNDYGLMQINTCNHEWLSEQLGITDFLDPTQNIRSGLYILRNLFEKYDDPVKVLMCYNMGEKGAKRLWDKGIYETDDTLAVMANAEVFQNYIDERMVQND